MTAFKKYPKIEWNDPIFWLKMVGIFLLIGMTQLITFLYLNIPYIIPLPLFLEGLLFFAIDQKQNLLSRSINEIISIIKEEIIQPLLGQEAIGKYNFRLWNFYRNKRIKSELYIIGIFILYFIFFVLYSYHSQSLFITTPQGNSGVYIEIFLLIALICLGYYLDSFYIKKYLEDTISMCISILSDSGKDISPFKVDWARFDRRIIIDWIVGTLIILFDIILYKIKILTLFNNGTFISIFLFAFLYPSTRLTIDLNIQFNRFSSALEKLTSDLFRVQNEGT